MPPPEPPPEFTSHVYFIVALRVTSRYNDGMKAKFENGRFYTSHRIVGGEPKWDEVDLMDIDLEALLRMICERIAALETAR